MVHGIYGAARMDSAYRMMNMASSQSSMLNSLGPNSDMKLLHQMDMRNSLEMEKEKFNYQVLEKLEEMNDRITEEKIKRDQK